MCVCVCVQLDILVTNFRAVMNDVRQNPSSPFMYLDMGMGELESGYGNRRMGMGVWEQRMGKWNWI